MSAAEIALLIGLAAGLAVGFLIGRLPEFDNAGNGDATEGARPRGKGKADQAAPGSVPRSRSGGPVAATKVIIGPRSGLPVVVRASSALSAGEPGA